MGLRAAAVKTIQEEKSVVLLLRSQYFLLTGICAAYQEANINKRHKLLEVAHFLPSRSKGSSDQMVFYLFTHNFLTGHRVVYPVGGQNKIHSLYAYLVHFEIIIDYMLNFGFQISN